VSGTQLPVRWGVVGLGRGRFRYAGHGVAWCTTALLRDWMGLLEHAILQPAAMARRNVLPSRAIAHRSPLRTAYAVWLLHIPERARPLPRLDIHFVSPAPVQSPLGVGAQHAAPLQRLAVYL